MSKEDCVAPAGSAQPAAAGQDDAASDSASVASTDTLSHWTSSEDEDAAEGNASHALPQDAGAVSVLVAD